MFVSFYVRRSTRCFFNVFNPCVGGVMGFIFTRPCHVDFPVSSIFPCFHIVIWFWSIFHFAWFEVFWSSSYWNLSDDETIFPSSTIYFGTFDYYEKRNNEIRSLLRFPLDFSTNKTSTIIQAEVKKSYSI